MQNGFSLLNRTPRCESSYFHCQKNLSGFFLRVTKVHVNCLNTKALWRQCTLVLPSGKLPQANSRQGYNTHRGKSPHGETCSASSSLPFHLKVADVRVSYPEVKMPPLYQRAPALRCVRAGQHRAPWLSPGVTVSLHLCLPHVFLPLWCSLWHRVSPASLVNSFQPISFTKLGS